MNKERVNISEIKENSRNPRYITEDNFKRLVKDLTEFPKMLEARPLIIDEKNVVLGGNQRLKALIHLGYTEVPVDRVTGWTKKEKDRFIIQDNLSRGGWDYDELANTWALEDLTEWGLNIPDAPKEIDYSILDDDDESLEDQLSELSGNVKKGILIDFLPEHYAEALEIVNFWRKKGLYVGSFLIEKLNEEKNKIKS